MDRTRIGSLAVIALVAAACASGPEKPVWRSTQKPAGEVGAERQLFEILNRERREAGLSPLSWSSRAGVMASGYSIELRAKSPAGSAPAGGGAADRVRVASSGNLAALQSAVPTHDLEELHRWLMSSADGRAILLSGSATEVGIGVTFGDEVSGRGKTFITVIVWTPPATPVAAAEAAPADGAPPPVSSTQPPHQVPPTRLEDVRISGSPAIVPNDSTKLAIRDSGQKKLVGTFKLCLTPDGVVADVERLKTTGFPAYDHKIMREMKEWRYRPYQVDGKPVRVCTAVVFVYSQK